MTTYLSSHHLKKAIRNWWDERRSFGHFLESKEERTTETKEGRNNKIKNERKKEVWVSMVCHQNCPLITWNYTMYILLHQSYCSFLFGPRQRYHQHHSTVIQHKENCCVGLFWGGAGGHSYFESTSSVLKASEIHQALKLGRNPTKKKKSPMNRCLN